jgi:hypothetical protein
MAKHRTPKEICASLDGECLFPASTMKPVLTVERAYSCDALMDMGVSNEQVCKPIAEAGYALAMNGLTPKEYCAYVLAMASAAATGVLIHA